MSAKTLMIVGSMSSAGKSLLVTALCRIYAQQGLRVAPFKAQNMSNNAAVCADGSEIGRAQALQALAADISPTADMNPVLIKPEADSQSQVILMGKPWQSMAARSYYEKKSLLWEHVTASLDRLKSEYDLIIIEGAGSAAELNLKKNDIVNMAVAKYANAPVLIAGDIDRGGIFAQLLGTLWLLEADEKALVRGLLVNKFRGDMHLFKDGIQILEEKGNVPVLGVIPYLRGLNLPDEDAVSIEREPSHAAPNTKNNIDLAVLAFPRIANFDDFDALKAEPGVQLRYIRSKEQFGSPHAVILPGTKSTMADLCWLKETGLFETIQNYAQNGGSVVGICGGYQMLGQRIQDPDLIESNQAVIEGVGLLPTTTIFSPDKSTTQASVKIITDIGWLAALKNSTLNGYEIHMGQTVGANHWMEIQQRNKETVHVLDGSISADGKIWGCYLHGLFSNDAFRHAWLNSLGWQHKSQFFQDDAVQKSLDTLANAVEQSLDMNLLKEIIWGAAS